MDDALLARYATLIVEVGANIQPGQQVLVIAAPDAAPLVRAVAAECYRHGAVFVDPWYFDPYSSASAPRRRPTTRSSSCLRGTRNGCSS